VQYSNRFFVRALMVLITLLIGLVGCSPSDEIKEEAKEETQVETKGIKIGDERLKDWNDGGDWAAFGRTYGEQHYSPLKQINAGNLDRLGLAWSFDLGPENSVTGPLAIDGTLYFATGYSLVHAMDAQSGELKWVFDPQAAQAAGRKLRQGWGSRGLGWWNGKIYTGTQDGRLIAIDAKTGKQVWSVMTTEADDYRFISGPPRAFDGKVIIGHGGADAASTRGYVTAYDAETGEQLWRFFTVPGNPADGFESEAMRMAAETWAGEWWKYGGGGTVWNAITYDQELNQIYLGTGNGAPWNHQVRSLGEGDNLFLSSIVALDADSGDYVWHYQTNPAETWDYNAAMDMQVAELEVDGATRKVLMTAPKNGFFYVLDRINGGLISAKPYVPVSWATEIDLESGRPVEVPGVRYQDGGSFRVVPGTYGAHNWLPMSYSPRTGLVYIPAIELSNTFSEEGVDIKNWTRPPDNILDAGANAQFPLDEKGASALVAWDPVTQTQRWRVPTPAFWNGGTFVTASDLVVQGHIDGSFNVFSAHDGTKLWTFDAGSPAVAPPITYLVGDTQYITVLTGMGTSGTYLGPILERFGLNPAKQARRVLTFALDGKATLPASEGGAVTIPEDLEYKQDKTSEARGLVTYAQRCGICHGFRAVGVGVATDLRASAIVRSTQAFTNVLYDGLLVAGGMPQFDELDDNQVKDLQQYIRSEAYQARQAMP
jgi:quinohemoprotein ethanol dehydrogenase